MTSNHAAVTDDNDDQQTSGAPAAETPTAPLTDDEIGHAAGMVALLADPDSGAMRAIPAGSDAWLSAAQATHLYQRRADGDDPTEQEWKDVVDRAEELTEDPAGYVGDTDTEIDRVYATQAVASAAQAGYARGLAEETAEWTDSAIEAATAANGAAQVVFDRADRAAREQLAVDRENETRWNAAARDRVLDQAGTPDGLNVNTERLLPRDETALTALRDEGKLNYHYVDPATGEVLPEHRDGAYTVVTLNDAGRAELANRRGQGTPPPRCGATSFSSPHLFEGDDGDMGDYETCGRPADDPIHQIYPADKPDPTICGATSSSEPHPFEASTHVRDRDGYYEYEFCAQPADAPVHQPVADDGPPPGDAVAGGGVSTCALDGDISTPGELLVALRAKADRHAGNTEAAGDAHDREAREAAFVEVLLARCRDHGLPREHIDLVAGLQGPGRVALDAADAAHAASSTAHLAAQRAVRMATRHVAMAGEAAGTFYR